MIKASHGGFMLSIRWEWAGTVTARIRVEVRLALARIFHITHRALRRATDQAMRLRTGAWLRGPEQS